MTEKDGAVKPLSPRRKNMQGMPVAGRKMIVPKRSDDK